MQEVLVPKVWSVKELLIKHIPLTIVCVYLIKEKWFSMVSKEDIEISEYNIGL